jgi:hypothetical protein
MQPLDQAMKSSPFLSRWIAPDVMRPAVRHDDGELTGTS